MLHPAISFACASAYTITGGEAFFIGMLQIAEFFIDGLIRGNMGFRAAGIFIFFVIFNGTHIFSLR